MLARPIKGIERMRLTISHKSEKVDIRLHSLGVKPAKIPIIRGQSQANTILGSIGGAHLAEEHRKVASISQLAATALRFTGVLPVEIDTSEAILIHVVTNRLDKSRSIGLGGHHITPCSMRRGLLITHVETADSDPSLELTALGEVGEFTHLLGIVVVGGGNLEAGRVDESKGIEKMGEACCVELLGGLCVAFTCTHIPRLVVADSSTVGAAAALCAGGRGGDAAGSVAGLAGEGLVDGVGVVTKDLSCLWMQVSMKLGEQRNGTYTTPARGRAAEVHTARHITILTVLSTHSLGVTVGRTSLATVVGSVTTDTLGTTAAIIS